MGRSPLSLNDVVLRFGAGGRGLTTDASGALLAAIASSHAPTVAAAARTVIDNPGALEKAELEQLESLASRLEAAGPGEEVGFFPRRAARRISLVQEPSRDLGLNLEGPLPPMGLSISVEELDGSWWMNQTVAAGERENQMIAVIMTMVTERRPLSWIRDRLKQL